MLPILHQRSAASNDDLVRLYMQADRRWAEHLAEPVVLEPGTLFFDPALPELAHVRDALVPEGMSATQAWELVERHFRTAGAVCRRWLLNPAAPAENTQSLVAVLEAHGYRRADWEVMALPHLPPPLAENPGLQIIPARASYALTGQLLDRAGQEVGSRSLSRQAEAHLDDSHVDALLAMASGRPVGHAAVFGAGEIARLGLFYVAPESRRRGIGRTLMSRILELCRRSLYRHILAAIEPEQPALAGLYAAIGMKEAGRIVCLTRRDGEA